MTIKTTHTEPTSLQTKQAYQEKVGAEFDKLNAQIDEFKAKADQAKAEVSIEYSSKVEELCAKRDAMRLKLEELQKTSEDAWADIETGFRRAWDELSESFQKAMSKFD